MPLWGCSTVYSFSLKDMGLCAGCCSLILQLPHRSLGSFLVEASMNAKGISSLILALMASLPHYAKHPPALWRYNSHTIYSAQICTVIVTTDLRTSPSPRKETLYPLAAVGATSPWPLCLSNHNSPLIPIDLPVVNISYR